MSKFLFELLWQLAIRAYFCYVVYLGLHGMYGDQWKMPAAVLIGLIGLVWTTQIHSDEVKTDSIKSDIKELKSHVNSLAASNSADWLRTSRSLKRIDDTVRHIEIRLPFRNNHDK